MASLCTSKCWRVSSSRGSSLVARSAHVPRLMRRVSLEHRKEAQQLLPAALLSVAILAASPAQAFEALPEPGNALSLPTWAIHVSSVLEWVTAMGLFWKYAEVTGNQKWKGMTWGMLPSLGSAMCACTWHFFYNAPSLEFLVATQALLTVVGNTTCGIAAYRIYDAAQKEKQAT